MTAKSRKRLLKAAGEMLLSGIVPDTTYADEMWVEAQAAR